MASTAQLGAIAPDNVGQSRPNPVAASLAHGVIFWHLLSLDAPTVAMLWVWFVSRASGVDLPKAAVISMGLAVWLLYAADRLLDARGLEVSLPDSRQGQREGTEDFEARHHFHRHYRKTFRLGIALASIALAVLLPRLPRQSVRLYLILGVLLCGYFVLVHVGHIGFSSGEKQRELPKELAVGFFFAAAIFVPPLSHLPLQRANLLPGAILFALVCSLNCLFIHAWEHPGHSQRIHTVIRLTPNWLTSLTIATAAAALTLAIATHGFFWQVPAACCLATVFLLLLHHYRGKLDRTTLRAAGDLCLLTPLVFLPRLLW